MNLYGAVVAARNALYDRGVLKQSRLQRPVVSVGNLSVGGSGKTPFVILLAELLRERGVRVDVLSRGYGRRSSGVLAVEDDDPARFGDEPVLIRRRLGDVPVIVGASRYEAGVEAERRFETDLHLLDDGFQHRDLARDFDIVLLSPRDVEDCLLPSGRLREPLSSLRRADVIVLPASEEAPPADVVAGKPVWRVRRRIELAAGTPSRPFAFCAIADPERFRRDLENAGVEIAGVRYFRDHHAYGPSDIAALRQAADKAGANGFITTEKDAVKLGNFGEELGTSVARLVVELEKSHEAVDMLLNRTRLSVPRS